MSRPNTHSTPPLISVIIPAYNCEGYLKRAIISALAQTYPNCECIVIDDGSTDGTLDIIRSFGDRIQAIHQPNAGAAAARNTGIAAARGRYVAFLDADDYWLRTKLANQIRAFQEFPELALVCTSFAWTNDQLSSENLNLNGPPYAPEKLTVYRDLQRLLQDPYLGTPSVLVEKRALLEIGGFDTTLPIAEDVDMYFRVCANRAYAKLDQKLVYFQNRPQSLTKQLRGYQDNLLVLSNLEKRLPEIARLHEKLLQERRIEIYTWWIKDLLVRGEGHEARRILRESLKIGPIPRYTTMFLKSFLALPISALKKLTSLALSIKAGKP